MVTHEQEDNAAVLGPPVQDRKTSSNGESLSLGALLALLNQNRRLILMASIVGFVAATIFAFLLPVSYTATASFVPPGGNLGSGAALLMGQAAALDESGLLGARTPGDLYVAILKSHTVNRSIVERFGLMKVYGINKESKAEKALQRHTSFLLGSKDPVVTIEVTDHSAARARDLAEGYLQVLQKTSSALALTESSQRRIFFEQRLTQEKDQLADAEVALKQSEEKTGLVDPAGQTASNIQGQVQLQSQITTLRAQLASLLHDETEENPEVQRVRSEISSLQAKAAQMEKGAANGFGRPSTAQVPALELEYIRKARDVKYHEALFDIFAKQYEAARLDEAKDAPLQILDSPTLPDTKSGPPRSVIAATGLMLGLIGSSAWILFFRSARIEIFEADSLRLARDSFDYRSA